ncbi:MAG TPA: MgtC/SapB family protein [Methylomirabilota bacterium]|nr:MgtC/SapB family protein [Methylomirabilota bacterium]
MDALSPPAVFPYHDIAVKIVLALGVGLGIGLEREWAHKEIGVRTFAITALLGALASLLGRDVVIAALGGVFLLVAFLNVHSLLTDHSLEMTTSAALIVTVILGVLIGQGHYFTAATSAIFVTMLLAWKIELARFAGALLPEEIRGAVLLGLLSFVIYPLLPDQFVDPWELVNPQRAWVTVVVIAGMGFINYGLLRLYSMRGLYYAAILGGLVNSTAAVAELSAALKRTTGATMNYAVAVLLLTNVAMFLRNLLILAIFARYAIVTALPPLALMALAAFLFAWVQQGQEEVLGQGLQLSSPVSLRRVLNFGGLFVLLAALGTLVQRAFGSLGFLAVSVVGGLVSSASTTATAATLAAAGNITPETAGLATVLTSMASALVNMPLVYQQTRHGMLTRRLALISVALVALGLSILGLRERWQW